MEVNFDPVAVTTTCCVSGAGWGTRTMKGPEGVWVPTTGLHTKTADPGQTFGGLAVGAGGARTVGFAEGVSGRIWNSATEDMLAVGTPGVARVTVGGAIGGVGRVGVPESGGS